jgi:hypothetical protein
MQQFGGKDSKRHFTVVMDGKEHGLYVSSTPSSAAKKAVTKLCAANKSKKVEFSMREITQGSKKKTYGTYKGHLEKLKEPIELKGRVIKYKPVVYSNKKTATMTEKNIYKKMSGGTITDGGDLVKEDFIIQVEIDKEELDVNNVNHSKYHTGSSRPLTRYCVGKIVKNECKEHDIQPCEIKLKNNDFKKPFIFFGKEIYQQKQQKSSNNYYINYEPIVLYEYVVYVKKKFFVLNKVTFKRIDVENFESKSIEDIDINDIPKEKLLILKEFLEKNNFEGRDIILGEITPFMS